VDATAPSSTVCGIQVNSNGLISFGATINNEHTPRPLPVSTPSTPFVAPFWADVNTTENDGQIYYRTVTAGTFHTMNSYSNFTQLD